MFLVPIFAAGPIWAIARGARPARGWVIPLALAASLSLSALVTVKSGEQQSERVAGGVALAGVGARVGHTGGQLAYRHGAAAVYAAGSAVGASSAEAARRPDRPRGRSESER